MAEIPETSGNQKVEAQARSFSSSSPVPKPTRGWRSVADIRTLIIFGRPGQ